MRHGIETHRSHRFAALSAVAIAAIIAACASNAGTARPSALVPQELAEMRQHARDVYVAGQVTKAAAPARGNMPPQYPEILKLNGIGGWVMLSFVVDTTGRVDINSAKVDTLSDNRFLATVVAALPTQLFTPAELQGRKVRQLVSVPYYFGMKDTTTAKGAQTIDQAVKTLTGAPLRPIKP